MSQGADESEALTGRSRSIGLAGDIDMATEMPLFIVEPGGAATVVTLDLGGVTFIDAAGIGVVLRFRNAVQETNAEIRMVHVSPRAARVFQLAGLAALLECPLGGAQ